MIIKILLTIFTLFLFTYSFANNNLKILNKWIIYPTLIFAIYCIWNPTYTTYIANLIGVGRGTDLLVYILILSNLFLIIKQNLKFHDQEEKLTILCRKVSILELRNNDKNES